MIESLAADELTPNSRSAVLMSMFRKDRWPSRTEAEQSCRKAYKSWDAGAIDAYLKYGLTDLPAGDVVLSTPKLHEVNSYYRPKWSRATQDADPDIVDSMPFYRSEAVRTLKNLQHLRPECMFVFGDRSSYSSAEAQAAKTLLAGKGVGGSKVDAKAVVLDGSHFVPMENIEACATTIAAQLELTWVQWKDTEEAWRINWADQQRAGVAVRWLENLSPYVEKLRTGKSAKGKL